MAEGSDQRAEPDWDKAREVALALLLLSRVHGRGHSRRRRPQIPFLEDFEQQGWIDDSNPSLGWVELTDAGWDRARSLLRKHFGIVVRGRELDSDGQARVDR